MRRAAMMVSLVLCAAFLMCSCTPGGEEEPSPPNGATAPPPSDTTGGPGGPPSYALEYIPFETVCSLSAPPELYRPDVGVFPLVNTPALYKECIDGPVMFAGADGAAVPLPEGVEQYYALYQYDFTGGGMSRIPQCVMLMDGDGKLAVMLLDGSVTTGFEYDLYFGLGDDYPYFSIREGYLMVTLLDGYQNAAGDGRYYFGLLDIRTGEMVIPCEYDFMELYNGAVYAERGGESMLFDYGGAMAVSFGTRAINDGVAYTDYLDYLGAGLSGDSYIIIDKAGGTDVCRTRHDPGVVLYAMDSVNLLVRRPHETGSEITVTDGGGAFLFAARGGFPPNFWVGENGFVIKHDGIITAVTKDGRLLEFNYDAGEDFLYNVRCEDGLIHASSMIDYYTEELRIISADGSYTTEHTRINPQTGYFRYRENDGAYETAYADGDGNIVIPYGLYEDFAEIDGESRTFILAYTDWGTSPAAIYNRDGELLADGLFGVIEELYAPDRIVVYFAPGECGFLSSDGGFTPIPGVPDMDKIYYGG